jgi:hypothetical protein
MSTINSWGPKTWNFLHTITLHYPVVASESTREAMYNLLHSIGQLIPCDECRKHYGTWQQRIINSSQSDALSGRESIFNAIVELHNTVNVRIGKPTLSTEAAHQVHGNFNQGSACPQHNGLLSKMWSSDFARTLLITVIVGFIMLTLIRRQRTLTK